MLLIGVQKDVWYPKAQEFQIVWELAKKEFIFDNYESFTKRIGGTSNTSTNQLS